MRPGPDGIMANDPAGRKSAVTVVASLKGTAAVLSEPVAARQALSRLMPVS